MDVAQMTGAEKPVVRVKAGRGGDQSALPAKPTNTRTEMRYLRDTRSDVLSTRPAILTNSRDDIRRAWTRAAGLANDLIQNSGRLSGAADQVISDTVGSGLELAPKPDEATLNRMGYDANEIRDLISLIKTEWKHWAWNPKECDHRGKLNVPQMIDIGLRWHMAYGEITQIMTFMEKSERQRYGIRTGTKVLMTPPSRLVQDTNEAEGLFQGVLHDLNGRPVQYRFHENRSGISKKTDYPAYDASGRPVVVHIFEPNDATDVRGISRLTAAFRKHILKEMLDDATVQTAIMQTVFAAALTSSLPSAEAFEAIEAVSENSGSDLGSEFAAMIGGAMRRAQASGVNFGTDPQVSHLAPGEKLEIIGSATPGPQYQPFSASLDREMARAIGMTYESFTLDNTNATYASSRVGNSAIWPVVMRRRERIAGPQCQVIYEAFFDEMVGIGRIPLKGGHAAFMANKDRLCWAQWRGPAKPSADDNKSAQASGRRLENRTTSLEIESADDGYDHHEIFEAQKREHQMYVDAGMESPYSPRIPRSIGGTDDVQDANLQLEDGVQ